jgi:hypothetical protein
MTVKKNKKKPFEIISLDVMFMGNVDIFHKTVGYYGKVVPGQTLRVKGDFGFYRQHDNWNVIKEIKQETEEKKK